MSYTYFTKDEQREQGISELMDLDTQVAILKTKGKNQMMFRTFDLDESSRLEGNLVALRQHNKDSGKTISLAKLDEDVTFPSAIPAEPEEPYKFFD